MQKGRRGMDKRIGLKGGEVYKENMQAEHHVSLDSQPRIYIYNTRIDGGVSGAVAHSLTHLGEHASSMSCTGYYDLDLVPNKNYEVVVSENDRECVVEAFELTFVDDKLNRKKVPLTKECF